MDQKPQRQIPSEVHAYLERLMEDAHVLVVDEQEKEQVIQYLFERLDKYLAAKIVENMSAEDTQTFIKMNEEKKPQEEIDAFLQSHMKNPEEVFAQAFVDFRDFYLTGQSNAGQSGSSEKKSDN